MCTHLYTRMKRATRAWERTHHKGAEYTWIANKVRKIYVDVRNTWRLCERQRKVSNACFVYRSFQLLPPPPRSCWAPPLLEVHYVEAEPSSGSWEPNLTGEPRPCAEGSVYRARHRTPGCHTFRTASRDFSSVLDSLSRLSCLFILVFIKPIEFPKSSSSLCQKFVNIFSSNFFRYSFFQNRVQYSRGKIHEKPEVTAKNWFARINYTENEILLEKIDIFFGTFD